MNVTIVGGGMITQDQLLPALLHLKRMARVDGINVCASRFETVSKLAAHPIWRQAFPDVPFDITPSAPAAPDTERYLSVLDGQAPGSLVVIATPDPLHFEMVMNALQRDQHVIVVKPLVMHVAQAEQIRDEAYRRGLFVGVEYHKRLDDRSLMARARYRDGRFGEFRLGSACLLEKWHYRHSNFQNWCTTEQSDAFTYIGCHYVDLVHFITGLEPVEVSVYGLRDQFPNGNSGWLWTDARIIWNNDACLNVQNALGFPDAAPGTNTQGLTMYCSKRDGGAWLQHSDQYRGLSYALTDPAEYSEPSPDYFQYVEWDGPGKMPVGYGYRSVERLFDCAVRVQAQSSLAERQRVLRDINERELLATPANSLYNERVIEAGRASIAQRGKPIRITT